MSSRETNIHKQARIMRRLGRPRGSIDLHGHCARAVVTRRGPTYEALAADFGRQLTSVMRDRAVAASELAAAIGVSTMTILAWRRGRSIPAVASLLAMAMAMNCALVDLLPESARYQ